jgi:hypothetical protein
VTSFTKASGKLKRAGNGASTRVRAQFKPVNEPARVLHCGK